MAKIDKIRIAIACSNDNTAVMEYVTRQYVSEEGIGWEHPPTNGNIEDTIAKWLSDKTYSCLSWRVLSDDEQLPDRAFRGAWRFGAQAISIDMPKAREIHKAALNKECLPLLAALDVEFKGATEIGDKEELAKIAAQKKVLMDVTARPEIEAAATPEHLASLTIDILTR